MSLPLLKRKRKLTIKYDKRNMELRILKVPDGYEYDVQDVSEG